MGRGQPNQQILKILFLTRVFEWVPAKEVIANVYNFPGLGDPRLGIQMQLHGEGSQGLLCQAASSAPKKLSTQK